MCEHNSNIPLFEPARGRCQFAGEPHEAAVLLDSPNKIDVLKQREWLEPAKGLINAAPHKDTRISIAETEQPKPWIRDRQLPRCLEIAVKSERKVSGCYRLIGKCTFHGTKSIQPGSGVSVNEPHDLARRPFGSCLLLLAAAAGAVHNGSAR